HSKYFYYDRQFTSLTLYQLLLIVFPSLLTHIRIYVYIFLLVLHSSVTLHPIFFFSRRRRHTRFSKRWPTGPRPRATNRRSNGSRGTAANSVCSSVAAGRTARAASCSTSSTPRRP